ncbi:MAG: universal stress protein [Dehalococcoidia bacterium]
MVRFTVCVVAFALFVGLQSASAQESHPHRIAYVVNGNPCVADAETHKYGCFVNTQPAHVGSMAWSPDGALIAMTTGGAGAMRRLLLGSVADKVMRGAETPVLMCNVHQMPEHGTAVAAGATTSLMAR